MKSILWGLVVLVISFASVAWGAGRDYAEEISGYEKVADTNHLEACEALARIYASCPDPRFHDGEKAVKFADIVASAKPDDPEALALLAAAQARNMDFRNAVKSAKKAGSHESKREEKDVLKQREAAYKQGEPFPPIATREWMLEAVDRDSQWAVDHTLWKMADRCSPLYDPKRAMELCEAGIKKRNKALYLNLGDLYLDAGDLEEAQKCYDRFMEDWRDYWKDGNRMFQAPAQGRSGHLTVYPVENVNSQRRLLDGWYVVITTKSEWELTGQVFYGEQRFASMEEAKGKGRARWHSPEMDTYEFLTRIAAMKGDEEAANEMEVFEQKMRASRSIIENEAGLDDDEWAAKLIEEAVKYCNNDVFPVNLPLAEECIKKFYALNPSARNAYILGCLHLRDGVYTGYISGRNTSAGIFWLELARAEGYRSATRRLAEFYACDPEEDNCDGELALKYATEYSAACPPDDPVALRLLALAQARDGNFREAVELMEKVLAVCPKSMQKASWPLELNKLKEKEACVIKHFRDQNMQVINGQPSTVNCELLADWVSELD